MKRAIHWILGMLLLASCNGWVIQPGNPPTPFLPPTQTPSIFTATPVVIVVASPTPQISTSTAIPFITATFVPTLIPSEPPAITETNAPTGTSVSSASELGYRLDTVELGGQPAAVVSDMDAVESGKLRDLLKGG